MTIERGAIPAPSAYLELHRRRPPGASPARVRGATLWYCSVFSHVGETRAVLQGGWGEGVGIGVKQAAIRVADQRDACFTACFIGRRKAPAVARPAAARYPR